jgi:hypothetical protein
MTLLSGLFALGSLVLTVALLPVPGGVVLAPFTFGLFLFALVGVLAGREGGLEHPRVAGSRAPSEAPEPAREAERVLDRAA